MYHSRYFRWKNAPNNFNESNDFNENDTYFTLDIYLQSAPSIYRSFMRPFYSGAFMLSTIEMRFSSRCMTRLTSVLNSRVRAMA